MRLVVKVLVVVALALATGVPTAYTTFVHSERDIVIGAHDATVQPSFDGWAEIDFGAVLPRMRLPANAPAGIGVEIRLGEADVTSLQEIIARDAVIASQPEGELETLNAAVRSMALDAVARGVGVGLLVVLLTVVVWRAVGRTRRRELLKRWGRPTVRRGIVIAAAALVTVIALALVAAPDRPREDQTAWSPLQSLFPGVPDDAILDTIEVANTASARGSRALIEGAVATYRESQEFYGKLAVVAATAEVRTPEDGEITALVVTDRHDNIAMDPVARAIASRAGVSLLIDLGDDTSTGAAWEAFSLNSLAREFRGIPTVAVAGNHDTGGFVREQMEEKGFTVLDGEPVDVGGVRFIGSSDPRSSGLTAGYSGDESDNIAAISEQDDALTTAACEDGGVAVAAVHSSASAKKLAASGCVDLVLSGHLHRQVGPTTVEGENGRLTTTLSTGSTGGAVYAFALGSKLRRLAQVTIVTFKDGAPVGLQPVSFEPGGIVTVADYVALTPSPRSPAADE